jgi:hypothetical protein|tara:strand:+ start:67 stop:195 length:129 start_codon:yes stop_codon:yes gene_type:complete
MIQITQGWNIMISLILLFLAIFSVADIGDANAFDVLIEMYQA